MKSSMPEHFATRIPRGCRGKFFTEEPFKRLPANTMHEETFDTVEDDNIALVATELGLVAKDPLAILVAAEEGDIETALVGLENDDYGLALSDSETAAMVAKFSKSSPRKKVRVSRPVYYKTEPPKPAKGCVAPVRYDRETHKHVLGRQAMVIVRRHRHVDLSAMPYREYFAHAV